MSEGFHSFKLVEKIVAYEKLNDVEKLDYDAKMRAKEGCDGVCLFYRSMSQYKKLDGYLSNWVLKYHEHIYKSILTLFEKRLFFVTIRKEVRYNRWFDDKLTDLDISVANNHEFDAFHLSVLAFPFINDDTLDEIFVDKWIMINFLTKEIAKTVEQDMEKWGFEKI